MKRPTFIAGPAIVAMLALNTTCADATVSGMSETLLVSRFRVSKSCGSVSLLNPRCTGCIAFAVPLRLPRIHIPSVFLSTPCGRTGGAIRTSISASTCGVGADSPATPLAIADEVIQ